MRALREQQVEAERMVEAIEAALAADASLLVAGEGEAIRAHIDSLKTVRDGDDPQAIKAQITALDRASAAFAARRMDIGLEKAMKGRSVTEFR
jgi:molecular chaperone HscA